MKKLVLLVTAALLLGMASCQKEDVVTPINGTETPSTDQPMVKSVADLIGTDWTFSYTDTIDLTEYGCNDSLILSLTFGLSFDSTYAHLSFPENVVAMNVVEDGDEYSVDEVENMQYAYSYDPTTHTGALTATDLDGSTFQIPFTYDETTDAIVIVMHLADEGDEENAVPFQLVFHRNTTL
ncbi:MAG: hypothetical protein J5641_02840 [Bacteroidales bacterium]|nr:hypothetical protein [Bacteroidales bacterium]